MRSSAIGSRPVSKHPHALVAPAGSGLRARTGRGKRFVLIASQFNQPIVRLLVRGAVETLRRAGASDRDIRILWVPGVFELPVVAARVAAGRPRPDAIVALGAILRGETSQYAVLAHAVAQGLSQVAVTAVVPVTFGVIVAETVAQARARAGLPAPRQAGREKARLPVPSRTGRQTGQAGRRIVNRGAEAAHAALAVLSLFGRMNHAPRRR